MKTSKSKKTVSEATPTSNALKNFFKQQIKPYLPFLILLSVICWGTFAMVLNNGFVSDDIAAFVKSDELHSFKNVLSLKGFSGPRLLYAFTYQLFGLNPTPLHFWAILMHNLNAVLVFYFVLKVFENKKTAYISALLFAVHPIVTEPVNWISGKHYIANTNALLIIGLLYLYFRETKRKSYLIFSIVVLAAYLIMIKSTWTFITPFFAALIELFFIDEKKKKGFYPAIYLLVVGVFVAFAMSGKIVNRIKYMQNGNSTASTISSTSTEQAPQENKPSYINRVTYTTTSAAKLLVFPKDLSLYHEGEKVSNFLLISGQLILVISGGMLIYWISSKKHKLAGLLAGMYLSLLPTFSPIQVSWFIADRYLYFTSVFFVIFAALLIKKLESEIKIKNLSLYLTILIAGVYIYRDVLRNNDWQNRKTLWEATARTNPNSPKVHNNLGDVYSLEGNMEKAIASFEKAVELNPNYAEAMYNLGNAYVNTDKKEEGEALIQKALEMKPNMLE
ncbi:tetratricopeptide repeat protein [candidate division WWE3 bacterium]|nr:tetratricopeptide repeat protein [candidate division WWE3 bacterium]